MASVPSEPPPVLGRVDSAGRLVEAGPELAALQLEAGSKLGAALAIPQLVAIVRMARKLGVPVTRPAIAAGADRDIDLIVNALPEGEEVRLVIEGWNERPAAGPRLAVLFGSAADTPVAVQPMRWTVDDQLRLIAVSPDLADKLGVGAGEATGQPLTRLIKLEENEDGKMPLLAALAARRDFSGQKVRGRGEGAPLLCLSGEVVTTEDGSFAGFDGRAEMEGGGPPPATAGRGVSVAAIDEALDEALRSPIDRIIASADRIVERADGPLRSDYAAYAADISAAARHLLSVVRSMGEEPGNGATTVDLAAVAAEATVMLEASAESRYVTIHMDSSGPLPARGEERGVIQILVNLVGNAVRHSPSGGTVHLSFEEGGGSAAVTVADQGPGIDPADQQRIFERFERAGEASEGTGLGLAIARRLARSMGGDIILDSAPGEGARFTLTLPKA